MPYWLFIVLCVIRSVNISTKRISIWCGCGYTAVLFAFLEFASETFITNDDYSKVNRIVRVYEGKKECYVLTNVTLQSES